MIILVHKNGEECKHAIDANGDILTLKEQDCVNALLELASIYPDQLIVWSEEQLVPYLDKEQIASIFHHKRVMASFSTQGNSYIPTTIEYLEDNPFHKINREVRYPTWLMSTDVGGIYGDVLLTFQSTLSRKRTLGYFLNSIAKNGMPQGLFCYQAPLLKNGFSKSTPIIGTTRELYKFVKEHYRTRWIFFLFICLWKYEKKITLLPLLGSLRYKKKKSVISVSSIPIVSNASTVLNRTYDVIIPTMGREKYLYDVLKDFSNQTLLPSQVIIIEQDENEEHTSALDYIQEEKWPYSIKHVFIHKTGACNARNMAIALTDAPWVFFADDDNRFENDVVSRIFDSIVQYGVDVLTTSYLQKNEKQVEVIPKQWQAFGAGNSFVKGDLARSTLFDMALEFGYGEDTDYGMQLRRKGAEILYEPTISLLHLKAPIGGFRKPITFPWSNASLQPKPSPTVMYHKQKNTTQKQVLGYRLVLAFKFYKRQHIKNPFAYRNYFRKAWEQSIYWAKTLENKGL